MGTNIASAMTNGAIRQTHLQFKDRPSEMAFLKVVAVKQRIVEDLQVISRLYNEKDIVQKEFAKSLQDQFKLKPDW